MPNTGLVEGGPHFLRLWCELSISTPKARNNVPEKSSGRLYHLVFDHIKHPEKTISHVSVRDGKIKSATGTRLCSKRCDLLILFGQHVQQFLFVTMDRSFVESGLHVSKFANTKKLVLRAQESRKRFHNMSYRAKK